MIKSILLCFSLILCSNVIAQNEYGILKGSFYNKSTNNLHSDSVQIIITKIPNHEEVYNTRTLEKFNFQLAPGIYNLTYYLEPDTPNKLENIKVSINAITISNIDVGTIIQE